MKVMAYECPLCGDLVFSRARHDFRYCSCKEIAVDGGFDYSRLCFNNKPPKPVEIEVDLTKKQLYDDWNIIAKKDEYGIIKKNGKKPKWLTKIYKDNIK